MEDHPVFFTDAVIHPINVLILQFGPDSSRQRKQHSNPGIFSSSPVWFIIQHRSHPVPSVPTGQQELIKGHLMAGHICLF